MSRCVAGDALEEMSASETDDASDDDGSAIVMCDRLPWERIILRTTEKWSCDYRPIQTIVVWRLSTLQTRRERCCAAQPDKQLIAGLWSRRIIELCVWWHNYTPWKSTSVIVHREMLSCSYSTAKTYNRQLECPYFWEASHLVWCPPIDHYCGRKVHSC